MARILVAEHNPTTANYLKAELKKAGHTVEHVDNCLDAWRASANNQYDVFMVDVVMPGIDSFVLVQKTLQENPDMQIIFITGFAGVAMQSFADPSYIPVTTRPFHMKEIAARVRHMLGHGVLPITMHTASNEGNVVYADFSQKSSAVKQMQS
jgi:two-component system cell cycle response regulator CpdR